MKTTNRKKLNLNRESLIELNPDALPMVIGGADAPPPPQGGDDHRSYAVICVFSHNKKSCIVC